MRRHITSFRLAACSVATMLVAACGGGSGDNSSTPTPTATNQSVGGIWTGQIVTTSGVPVAGIMLATEDGRFFSSALNLDNSCADIVMGNLTSNGSTLSGTAQFGLVNYTTSSGVTTNCTFADGSNSGTAVLSGSIAQRSSLTLTASDTTSIGTVLSPLTGTLTYDALYNETSNLSKIAGNWTGPTGAVLTIDAQGTIFQQDASTGCVVNGQVTIIDSNYNAYSASVTYANCEGGAVSLNGATATGLMALDDTVSPNVLHVGYSVALSNGQTLLVVVDATR